MDSQLQRLREINLKATKEAIRNFVQQDTLVIQAANSLETIQRTNNTLCEKLREWFVLYAPEISRAIKDNKEFAQKIINKNREELLFEIQKKETMGGQLSKKDIMSLNSFANTINESFKQEKELQEYIETTLKQICPNTIEIAGPQITSKLLFLAGGIKKLSEMTSSTIQILGAEKALFRHIKQGAKTPKFGVIHAHELVQKSRLKNKGKAARALSDKISIAIKVDFFKGKFIGDKLKKQLDEKLK